MNTTSYDMLPHVLTAQDLSKFLNISRAGAYQLLNSKDFPTLRVGQRFKRVSRDALLKWMEEHTDCGRTNGYATRR